MKKKVSIQNKTEYKQCMDDIEKEIDKKLKMLQKSRKWLQFAKKTKNGYIFLPNRGKQWEILEKISNKVAKRHKNFTTGQIVDLLSKRVNE